MAISPRWGRMGAFGLLLGISLGTVNALAQIEDDVHFGFWFDRHVSVFLPGTRTEAVGPFFYDQKSELAHTWAIPPLFSHTDWLDGDAKEYDFAYPLLTLDRFGGEYRWQLGQLFSFAGGRNQAEVQRDRFTLFPIYFQQRSADSNYNYTALFPIYGHLKNRIFRSEIDFVLWPLYVKTVKRPGVAPEPTFLTTPDESRQPRTGELTTYNYFLPFFHLRYGDGLFGWQLWPLLGRENKDVTTKTNSWGEAEAIPGHDKRFYLWPFFLKQHRGIGSDNPERELLMFPFYNRLRSPQRDSTSYLTPFGLTLTEDRGKKYREVDAPWPLIVFAWGEGKTTRRVWPLFSQAKTSAVESDFYLWPAYTRRRIHSESLDRERTRCFYFLYSHTSEKNVETAAEKTRTDCWPLFTYRRELDGRTRLQLLAPLEPILPASKSIERNYSPLWSVWCSERNPNTGARSQSFLWNLYRNEVLSTPASPQPTPPLPVHPEPKRNLLGIFSTDTNALPAELGQPSQPSFVAPPAPILTKKVSLLFGLFQYESTGENRRWRLFYLPLNTSQKISAHVPEHR